MNPPPRWPYAGRGGVATVLAAALALAGCGGAAPTRGTAPARPSATAVPEKAAAGGAGTAEARPLYSVAPLRHRVRPDVSVVAPRGLPADKLERLRGLGKGGFTVLRTGTLRIGGTEVRVAGVDPSGFRSFAPEGTAESDAVWQAVARGEVVIAHDLGQRLLLPLGSMAVLQGRTTATLRVGAYATVGLPDASVVVSDAVADDLGIPPASGALLSSGRGDPTGLADGVRRVLGNRVRIDLLTQPTVNPTAFLTGTRAARAFGAFSYRYFPDGTIEPDDGWVAKHIGSGTVPILGRVTCHRLMFPQLRAALGEIERAGLGDKIYQYAGCYVPRFIEHNPQRSVSLHTWGIALDLNVPTNMVGTPGDMDPQIVAIFKRWGFRWGGDWSTPDPMHFELAALLSTSQVSARSRTGSG